MLQPSAGEHAQQDAEKHEQQRNLSELKLEAENGDKPTRDGRADIGTKNDSRLCGNLSRPAPTNPTAITVVALED